VLCVGIATGMAGWTDVTAYHSATAEAVLYPSGSSEARPILVTFVISLKHCGLKLSFKLSCKFGLKLS